MPLLHHPLGLKTQQQVRELFLIIFLWIHSRHQLGVWGEAVRVVSGLRRDATAPVLDAQFNGTPTPPLNTWPTSVSSELDQLAASDSRSTFLCHSTHLICRSGQISPLISSRHPITPSASAPTQAPK